LILADFVEILMVAEIFGRLADFFGNVSAGFFLAVVVEKMFKLDWGASAILSIAAILGFIASTISGRFAAMMKNEL
jgi:predicted lysophospholipase L1 biosynthesis ABC-type transport system permease subunit